MNQHDLSELFDDIREYINDLEQKLADRKKPSDGECFRWESRMDNITERLAHIEQVVVTYMSESTKQWTEERLRALELQVKELRHGEGPKADRKRYVEDELPANYVPVDITAAIESDLRSVRRDKGPEWEGINPDADHGYQGEVPRPTDA